MLRSKNLGALQRRRALQRAESSAADSEASSSSAAPDPESQRGFDSKRKAEFLQQAGQAYGYDGRIEALQAEFPQLAGQVYVDHAGATMHSAQQLRAVFQVRLIPLSESGGSLWS